MRATISTSSIRIVTLVICLAMATVAAAQPRPRRPPRDVGPQAEAPEGTAVISGRVLAADTGRPVKRAYVRATAAELRGGRGALTDAEGRYTLDGLPAGRYTIRASKIGFVTVAFGQRRPLQPGTPVDVRDDKTLKGVNLQLPRGSVITGHLVDEDGEPMVGVDVRVLRHAYRQVSGASSQRPAT